MFVRSGIHLFKLWFSVSRRAATRFMIRRIDPVRQWKLSPMDLASLDQWDEYTAAKEAMFLHSDTADAPWTVIRATTRSGPGWTRCATCSSASTIPSRTTPGRRARSADRRVGGVDPRVRTPPPLTPPAHRD